MTYDLEQEIVQTALAINLLTSDWSKGRPVAGEFKRDPIFRILRDKIDRTDIGKVIPDHLLICISFLSCGNPGMCQLLLKEVLLDNKSEVKRRIDTNTQLSTSGFKRWLERKSVVPYMEVPEVFQEYGLIWEQQKLPDGSNAVDTLEYWHEILLDRLDHKDLPYIERWTLRHRQQVG